VRFVHLNRRFIDLKKVALTFGQESENYFKVPFYNLNNRFSYFPQIAFSTGQGAENEVEVT